MDEVRIAWAAGIFEGEGTIGRWKQGTGWYVSVAMTDVDVLELLQDAVGMGKIYGPYSTGSKLNGEPCRLSYRWHINDKDGLLRFGEMILPFMGQRRRARLECMLDGVRDAPSSRRYKVKPGIGHRDDPRWLAAA